MSPNVREVTCALHRAMDEGMTLPRAVADAALTFLSEDDVRKMARSNELFPFCGNCGSMVLSGSEDDCECHEDECEGCGEHIKECTCEEDCDECGELLIDCECDQHDDDDDPSLAHLKEPPEDQSHYDRESELLEQFNNEK